MSTAATLRNSKSSAMTLRFEDDYTRRVIEKAASLLNQTRTGFLISVARKRAEEVIRERAEVMQEIETLLLSPEESQLLAKRLENPKKPNPQLVRLMKDFEESGL